MGRDTSARQDQAHPLGWKEIKEFIESAGEGLRADRERAMLCVAYETLARRGELVALEVQDVEFWPNGTGHALIRRGKTDAEGQGRVAYLSRETVKWLKIWLEQAKINEGPIFRRLIGRDQIGDVLHPGSIAPIFKRVAQWIGMPARFVDEVSGHSTRVGAAQDLAELDIDLAAITQAGGWKSTRMPLQYAEKTNAARSGMARAAAATGRDEESPAKEDTRMQRKANAVAPFTLKELETIITASGGQMHARTYAKPLLTKVRLLEARGTYRRLLEPIRTARDQADLRGRILELN